jgi:cation:H+ antiporter
MALELLINVFISLVGIILITKGSDWATDSMIPIARRLGTSYLAVGLILVSIMVSLPEIIISVYATVRGHFGISFGVIIGSVICNIGLMTGISGMIRPLPVSKTLILRDGIFAVCLALLIYVLARDSVIDRVEGIFLFLMFIPYLIVVWNQEKRLEPGQKDIELKNIELRLNVAGLQFGKMKAGMLTFFLGTVLLLFGSYIFSDSLISLAKISGLSDIFIGLTIGAIGPSIPNIAAAIQGTLKDIEDVAVSETLGSNIFTLLVSLGILSMIRPLEITPRMFGFDIPIMVVMSGMLLAFMIFNKKTVTRFEGFVLFGSYAFVLALNVAHYL